MPIMSKPIEIEIDKEQVCHYIGCDADHEVSTRVSSLIDDCVENVHYLLEPSYAYVIKNIERVQGSIVVIEGSVIFRSQVVARLLEQCHRVVVFVVTIGKYLEGMARRLAEDGLVLDAFVLDAIGSDAVEKVADFVQDKIRQTAGAQGLSTSLRFSPGYCDWDIRQQKTLFRVLGGVAGIRLTKDCLMIPRKSISGIIGIGSSTGNVEDYNPCRTCKKCDCPARR